MPNKSDKKYKSNSNSRYFDSSIILLTNIAHAIGVPGLIAVFFMWLIARYSTIEQKKQIIDTWILFKSTCSELKYTILVILFIICLFVIQQIYYSKRRSLDKEEINRLSEYKSKYQETAIGKNLHHT
jgi:hypothetical protein